MSPALPWQRCKACAKVVPQHETEQDEQQNLWVALARTDVCTGLLGHFALLQKPQAVLAAFAENMCNQLCICSQVALPAWLLDRAVLRYVRNMTWQ